MTDAKHTPGPWKVSCEGWPRIGPYDGFMPFSGCGCCGSPWLNGENEEEQIANARLIVAAPDMLDALQDLLADTQHAKHKCDDAEWCPVIKARAAISKATKGTEYD